jgi:23S rRNA (guanosine2251-2'-O)-methyltransferase
MSRFVFGVGPVTELLSAQARTISIIYVAAARKRRPKNDPVARLIADAKGRRVEVQVVPRPMLDGMAGAGQRHQGVIAVAGEYEYADLDDIIAAAEASGRPALVVALDGVTDPHNLGAIARSAHLFGAHGLVIPQDRAAAVTAVVTKTSAGATEHLAIAQVTNLRRALSELKEAGLWAAAVATAEDAVPMPELDGTGPLCLVLGAEGSGIRKLVAAECDYRVEIPMLGTGVGSLNVSVAAGVALYEIARQRRLRDS